MSSLAAQGVLDVQAAVEAQAASGRGYLRGAVTLLEHAAVLLAPATENQREDVPGLADRLEEALAALRRGEIPDAARPAPEPAEPLAPAAPAPAGGGLW